MATYDQAIFQRGEERDIKGESVAAEHRLETKESGRCRELLNKSHCKDFLSVETKKSDRCTREVAYGRGSTVSIHYHLTVFCKRSDETEYEVVVAFITTNKQHLFIQIQL